MKFAGARGITRSRVPIIAMLALAATIGLAGCEGDDGKDGADSTVPGPTGPAGPAGPTGPSATKTPIETCGVCHGATAIADAAAIHVNTNLPTVSEVTFEEVGNDLVISFNLKLDGANATDFNSITSRNGSQTAYQFDGTTRNVLSDVDAAIPGDVATPVVLAGGTGGNYTLTIQGGSIYAGTNSRYLIRVANPANVRAYVVGEYPASPDNFAVASGACANCHGNRSSASDLEPHASYPFKAENCTVCHDADNYIAGQELPYVWIGHSIHNSHNMPGGKWVWEEDDPATPENEEVAWETTFPTYMNNCSICHAGNLDTVNEMPVSYDGCLSCHGSMAGFGFEAGDPISDLHLGATDQTNCQGCHAAGQIAASLVVVTDFHNGLLTENDGIIWDGEDTSVTEGAKFDWTITGVVDDGTNLAISWQATYDADGSGPGAPVGVNPCNATVGATAPLFHGDDDGNLSILRSYQQGDDFILGQGSAPGQPTSVGVTTTNTTCAGNVATTTIPVEDVDYEVGRLGMQGKPRVISVANASETMEVRAKSPTYDYVVGDGAKAPDRRLIVDTTNNCLKCHVGSLYQHGGNRVDNVDLCILCHNSASSDQNRRVDMGVDASEAYDGKAGQTFEMKSMLHAIHSTGETGTGAPIVIYRNRGIYAWADTVSQLPNWATGDACDAASVPGEDLDGNIVYGSDPESSTKCQVHNFHRPTYPRELFDCTACHVDGFDILPDQTKAVATTLDAGDSEDWMDQLDDVLEGASAAACMNCHQSKDSAEQAQLKGHAYQNGWEPTEFPEGRQTILDAAK